jgi:hypothetical protein
MAALCAPDLHCCALSCCNYSLLQCINLQYHINLEVLEFEWHCSVMCVCWRLGDLHHHMDVRCVHCTSSWDPDVTTHSAAKDIQYPWWHQHQKPVYNSDGAPQRCNNDGLPSIAHHNIAPHLIL